MMITGRINNLATGASDAKPLGSKWLRIIVRVFGMMFCSEIVLKLLEVL